MAAPTKAAANVKKALANSEPSTHGTSRHFAAPQNLAAIGVTADKGLHWAPMARQRLTHHVCEAFSGHPQARKTALSYVNAGGSWES